MEGTVASPQSLLGIISAMDEPTRSLVEAIHATDTRAVVAVSGAGSQALAWLLGVGGASRTLLEASVPYAQSAFAAYAGSTPAEFASTEAAVALATASLDRGRRFIEGDAMGDTMVVGIGCAATIATDRLKRGEHRAFVACAGTDGTRTFALQITKGARDRQGEEELVSRLILNALAEACGLPQRLDLGLLPDERLLEARIESRG